MNKDDIYREIRDMPAKDIRDLGEYIRQLITLDTSRNAKYRINENKKFVGKCYVRKIKPSTFPFVDEYFQVISENSSSTHRVSILKFTKVPLYYFVKETGNFGFYDFTSFDVDEININELESCREISAEEYAAAMDSYIDALKHMEWRADHVRTCNVLTGEKGWIKE